MKRINNYTKILDEVFNLTVIDVGLLNEEMAQIRKKVLQHRMTLDYLSAAQGGMCEVIHTDCCTYISDEGKIIEGHLKRIDQLQSEARHIVADGWNPFKGLGSFGDFFGGMFGWFKKVGILLLMALLFILFLYFAVKIAVCLLSGICKPKSLHDSTAILLKEHPPVDYKL